MTLFLDFVNSLSEQPDESGCSLKEYINLNAPFGLAFLAISQHQNRRSTQTVDESKDYLPGSQPNSRVYRPSETSTKALLRELR